MSDLIYLDNNATTRIDPRVVDAMLPLYREHWGNAGSGHAAGRAVGKAVNAARNTVADCFGVSSAEVVFTASGTESDNLAVRGFVLADESPCHVITTAVEHPAVLETCEDLASQGRCHFTTIGVDARGQLDLARLLASLQEHPDQRQLVSAMWANNESGVVHPISEVVALARAAGATVHVDAVQVIGKIPVRLDELDIDLLSISAHKFHGPKGVGALIVRKGTKLHPTVTGGGQEKGRRSGTENPAGIVGLATALQLAVDELDQAAPSMASLRDQLQSLLTDRIPGLRVTGEGATRTPNTLHVTVDGVEAEPMLIHLDRAGIACSAGSACSTGALEPSHVLAAMGVPASHVHGALRFSLSRDTTEGQVERVADVLPGVVERLRAVGEGRG